MVKASIAALLTFIASLLPDLLFREFMGYLPEWWLVGKIGLLLAVSLLFHVGFRETVLAGFGVVLSVVVAMQIFFGQAQGWMQYLYPPESFIGQFGVAVLLKVLGIIPVVGVLLLLYKSPREVYLVWGNLSHKALAIPWLGIPGGAIAWGRLAVVSGLLIAAGTILLSLLTLTVLSQTATFNSLLQFFPLILLMALANSFSEGVVYRNAVLGPLTAVIPKGPLMLIAGFFFGVAHFYGIPSGVLGVLAASALGWYMCRSMYETRGFAAAWIIHFCQDVVIFSTVVVVGGY